MFPMQTIHNRINWLVAATLLAALGGCTRNQCRECDGCGPGCVGQLPDPRGAHTQAVFDLHAEKAEADDFVVYQHEWTHGRDELGPRGRRHLEQIAKRLPHEPFAVVIETSGDATLDDNRRSHVLAELAALGVVDFEARVTVGLERFQKVQLPANGR
jgi:hypothetical protein